MNIIEKLEQHIRDLKAMKQANDFDGFIMVMRELKEETTNWMDDENAGWDD